MSEAAAGISLQMEILRPLRRQQQQQQLPQRGDSDNDDSDSGRRRRAHFTAPLTAENVAANVVTELLSRAQPVPTSELAEMSRTRYFATQCFSLIISVLAVTAVLALTLSANAETLNFLVSLVNSTRSAARESQRLSDQLEAESAAAAAFNFTLEQ